MAFHSDTRKLGSKGGLNAAKKMTPKQRSDRARRAAKGRWDKRKPQERAAA